VHPLSADSSAINENLFSFIISLNSSLLDLPITLFITAVVFVLLLAIFFAISESLHTDLINSGRCVMTFKGRLCSTTNAASFISPLACFPLRGLLTDGNDVRVGCLGAFLTLLLCFYLCACFSISDFLALISQSLPACKGWLQPSKREELSLHSLPHFLVLEPQVKCVH